jgi:hypothetical protein
MTLLPNPAQPTAKRTEAFPAMTTLPQWEQLRPEYQRELVMTLAAMLVKELPVHRVGQREASDE